MNEIPVPLEEIIIVNENSDIRSAGDISIFRDGEAACRSIEHWWVEDGEGFALTAAGHRVTLGVADHNRVVILAKEADPDGPALVRKWLEAQANALLQTRRDKAARARLLRSKIVLNELEQRGELPSSIEGLIAYLGFDS